MSEDLEFGEALEKYITINRMWHFESDSGVRNITRIAEAIGYKQGLQEMLADNPGMQNAIVEWLMQQNIQEWTDSLVEEMGDRIVTDDMHNPYE